MIITRTPVRISLFGGGTDYREYYRRQRGAVFGTTINKYVYTSVNVLSDFFDYKIRVGYSKSELINTIEDIQHPSVRECLRRRGVPGNLDIHIFSDLPARTGLGSSSSFTVGFLHALSALHGRLITKQELASEAHHVEQIMIGENVGSQDQVHAAFGGFNVAEFFDETFRVRPVVCASERCQQLDDALLLFYTGENRLASEVVAEQVQKTSTHDNDDYLAAMYDMVARAEVLCSDAAPAEFLPKLGELLHQGWELKKQLASQVSTNRIDDMYAAARHAGALGGKLCGAGRGGFLLLLVPPAQQVLVRSALAGHLEVPFQFEHDGSTIIHFSR